MSSHEQDGAVSGMARASDASESQSSRSIFARYAAQRPGLLLAFLVIGFIVGITYRYIMDPPAEGDLANYLRSGLHGVGIALAVWAVQTGFASKARSTFGAALKRLPVAGEVLIRSLVMTLALVIVGVSLQFVLYAGPF